jgi:tRNA dimethylallyltransferase
MSAISNSLNPLLIILGPTASGKTRLAVSLAVKLHAEIISADSRQIFKGMNIGTGKDLSEYVLNGHKVPYHLIDIKQAGERYHVNEFKEDFFKVFSALSTRKVLPILCGGTGMYINSLLQNHLYTEIPIDPVLRSELTELSLLELQTKLSKFPIELTRQADQSTIKRLIRAIEIAKYLENNAVSFKPRPLINPFVVGLSDELEIRRQKIASRLEKRLDEGMIDEVSGLLKDGVPADVLTFYGLEYKLIVSYLAQQIDFWQLKEQLFNSICQYAKRQMTFFRKMEKDGVNIHWYQADMDSEKLSELILNDYRSHFSGEYLC